MTRVLIVEDDDVLRTALAALLRRAGHEVSEVRDAEAALTAGAAFQPDVLVTDWMLGGTRHGLDVSRALRATQPALRTVLMTGYPSAEVRLLAEEHEGVVGFVEKPFVFEDLAHVVQRFTPAYAVACTHCRRRLMTTSGITETEVGVMRAHLEVCRPTDATAAVDRAALLRHFRVEST